MIPVWYPIHAYHLGCGTTLCIVSQSLLLVVRLNFDSVKKELNKKKSACIDKEGVYSLKHGVGGEKLSQLLILWFTSLDNTKLQQNWADLSRELKSFWLHK